MDVTGKYKKQNPTSTCSKTVFSDIKNLIYLFAKYVEKKIIKY